MGKRRELGDIYRYILDGTIFATEEEEEEKSDESEDESSVKKKSGVKKSKPKKSSAGKKKTSGKSTGKKRGKGKKKKKEGFDKIIDFFKEDKKRILYVALIIPGIIIGLMFSGNLAGSRFQLETSVNPVGYYYISFNYMFDTSSFDKNELNFTLLIVNNNSIQQEISITPDINRTSTFYAPSQTYAVLIGDCIRPYTSVIECSEDEAEPMENIIYIYPKPTNGNISLGIRKAYDYDVGISYIYKDNVNPPIINRTFYVDSNSTYVLYLDISFENNLASYFGDMIILPDIILQRYYPLTLYSNVSNYFSHMLIFNNSVEVLRDYSYDSIEYYDITEFTFSNNTYTSLRLYPISIIPNTTTIVSYRLLIRFNVEGYLWFSLFDGCYDNLYLNNSLYYINHNLYYKGGW